MNRGKKLGESEGKAEKKKIEKGQNESRRKERIYM